MMLEQLVQTTAQVMHPYKAAWTVFIIFFLAHMLTQYGATNRRLKIGWKLYVESYWNVLLTRALTCVLIFWGWTLYPDAVNGLLNKYLDIPLTTGMPINAFTGACAGWMIDSSLLALSPVFAKIPFLSFLATEITIEDPAKPVVPADTATKP
jgi:hypothetical protein